MFSLKGLPPGPSVSVQSDVSNSRLHFSNCVARYRPVFVPSKVPQYKARYSDIDILTIRETPMLIYVCRPQTSHRSPHQKMEFKIVV
jgi:hypothetical protein